MAGNYYDHTTFPQTGTIGSSAQMRAELELIEAGFNKLPDLVGNALKLIRINASGTAQEAVLNTTVQAADIVAATAKATPISTDMIPIVDSAAGNTFKKVTWADLLGTLDGTFLKSGDTAAALTITSATINGGAITGITDLAIADGGTGASTASGARTNLGLGTIATQNADNVAITGGSISGITDLAVADGGTGASDAAGARTNLGLGTISTQNANAVSITGGSINGTTIGATTASTGKFTTLEATGVGTFAAGTNTAPSITTAGDTNTGIYFPAADTIAFTEGGVEAMRIDSSGNVGIGATSPVKKLTTLGDIGIGYGNALCFTSGSGTFTADKAIYNYWDGGADRLQIQPSGSSNGIITFNAGAPATTRTERMRIDTSGNVGIGTSSPGIKLHVVGSSTQGTPAFNSETALVVQNNSVAGSFSALSIIGGQTGRSIIYFADKDSESPGAIQYDHSANAMFFTTNNNTERMRIDSSGNLLVGTTSASYAYSGNSARWIGAAGGWMLSQDTTSVRNQVAFFNPNGNVGSINTTGSSTIYGTSSDYRLKENIQPMQNALEFVRKQRPVTYNWKVDGSKGSGYIAHWMQEDGAGNCVTGEKDAVDKDGNPVYQGIDTSFMVAPLNAAIIELADLVDTQTKLIKELKAELDAAKAEVAALKAQINQGA